MDFKALGDIPDPQGLSFEQLELWVNERIEALRQTDFSQENGGDFVSVEFQEEFEHPLGIEASATWRRFFLATLVADWVSYDKPTDRADFARLKYIMTTAYKYTRVWFCKLVDGTYVPVGYTSWYPIAKFIYDGVLNNPSEVCDRGILMPLRFSDPNDIRYGYVFNISIARKLINTPRSRKLTMALKREGKRWPKINFLAIAVAPEGRKICTLSGFTRAADVLVQGETETLFVRHRR